MTYITVNQDVDVYFSDIEDQDLVDELESRGYYALGTPISNLINTLYQAYRIGNQEQVDELLKQLFYQTIGRSI